MISFFSFFSLFARVFCRYYFIISLSKLSFDAFFAEDENSDFVSRKEDAIRKTIRLKKNIVKGCVAVPENNVEIMKRIVEKYGITKQELAQLKYRPLRPKQLLEKFGTDFKVHLSWQRVLAERCDRCMCFIGRQKSQILLMKFIGTKRMLLVHLICFLYFVTLCYLFLQIGGAIIENRKINFRCCHHCVNPSSHHYDPSFRQNFKLLKITPTRSANPTCNIFFFCRISDGSGITDPKMQIQHDNALKLILEKLVFYSFNFGT